MDRQKTEFELEPTVSREYVQAEVAKAYGKIKSRYQAERGVALFDKEMAEYEWASGATLFNPEDTAKLLAAHDGPTERLLSRINAGLISTRQSRLVAGLGIDAKDGGRFVIVLYPRGQ